MRFPLLFDAHYIEVEPLGGLALEWRRAFDATESGNE
jgi:hypothetical protein